MRVFVYGCLNVLKHWSCAERRPPPPLSTKLPPSSNRVVTTVSMGSDAPFYQKTHMTWNFTGGSTPTNHNYTTHNQEVKGPRSCKHQTCRPFTVKHVTLMETATHQTHALQMTRIINYTSRTSEATLSSSNTWLKRVCGGSVDGKWEKFFDYGAAELPFPVQ